MATKLLRKNCSRNHFRSMVLGSIQADSRAGGVSGHNSGLAHCDGLTESDKNKAVWNPLQLLRGNVRLRRVTDTEICRGRSRLVLPLANSELRVGQEVRTQRDGRQVKCRAVATGK